MTFWPIRKLEGWSWLFSNFLVVWVVWGELQPAAQLTDWLGSRAVYHAIRFCDQKGQEAIPLATWSSAGQTEVICVVQTWAGGLIDSVGSWEAGDGCCSVLGMPMDGGTSDTGTAAAGGTFLQLLPWIQWLYNCWLKKNKKIGLTTWRPQRTCMP